MNDESAVQWKSGEIFQNDEFAKIYAKHRKYDVTEILGNTCFLIKRPPLGIVKANVYFCDGDANEFIDECYRISKEKHIPFIEIRTSIAIEVFAQFPCEQRGTYVINLLEDIETLWSKLDKRARNQVRQAKRNDIIILSDDGKDFLEWWYIFTKTVERKKFIAESFHLTKELFEHGRFSRLFVAKVNGKIAAGAFILLSNRGIVWQLGASNQKYLKYRPNHLLQWEIIRWAKEHGFSYYDMGGALPVRYDASGKLIDEGQGEGPSAFKKKFGGEYKELYSYNIIINKFKHKFFTTLINARFKLMRHL